MADEEASRPPLSPPRYLPQKPPPLPQRAKKKAAAKNGASSSQANLLQMLARMPAASVISGGQAVLRADEDRRRLAAQQNASVLEQLERAQKPAAREAQRERVEHAAADALRDERDARESDRDRRDSRVSDARALAQRGVLPVLRTLPVMGYNPHLSDTPPLALAHWADDRAMVFNASASAWLFPDVADAEFYYKDEDLTREANRLRAFRSYSLPAKERYYRELYIFKHLRFVRMPELRWSGNYGWLYKFMTHEPSSEYRRQEMAEMEVRCAEARIARRTKKDNTVVLAQPKSKFYSSNVKSLEGTFYSHLEQMNQQGGCDMMLLTIIPRPGVKDASLAAAWLEVPREMEIIYNTLKNWAGLVRFIMCVDVHPGSRSQRSKVKPAPGELGGGPAPAPRDDMQGVVTAGAASRAGEEHDIDGDVPLVPTTDGRVSHRFSAPPTVGVSANPATRGPRKKPSAAKKKQRALEKQRRDARDEREATEGQAGRDDEPSAEIDEREERARLARQGGLVVDRPPPLPRQAIPAAVTQRQEAYRENPDWMFAGGEAEEERSEERVQHRRLRRLSAVSQTDGAGDSDEEEERPLAVKWSDASHVRSVAGVHVDGHGTSISRHGKGGAKPGASVIEGDDEEGGEEDEPEGGEDLGADMDEERSVDEPGEELEVQDLFDEDPVEDAVDALPAATVAAMLQDYEAALERFNALAYLYPESEATNEAQAELAIRLAVLERNRIAIPRQVERSVAGEQQQDAGQDPAADTQAYRDAVKRDKLADADQRKLLHFHPHYHVSVTFTKASGQASADLGLLKAQLTSAGLKDVNIKRSHAANAGNWARIERYPLVTANDPLVHRFLAAVGHERVETLESGTLRDFRMRSAIEYTDKSILSHIPGFYKRLESYYHCLRINSINSNGDQEIPSLSAYFDLAQHHDMRAAPALTQAMHDSTLYVLRLADFMQREKLRIARVGKGPKDFVVYGPVEFRDPNRPRLMLKIDTAHELLCKTLEDFQGYVQNRGLDWLDQNFARKGQVIWNNFAPLVSGACRKTGEEIDAIGEPELDEDGEELPTKTTLPVLRRNRRWLAFGEGWMYLCDDPHNPDTPNARLRLAYLRKYSCLSPHTSNCLSCKFYVNLPVWFPLPRLYDRPASAEGDLYVKENHSWPSPFLYLHGTYYDHMLSPFAEGGGVASGDTRDMKLCKQSDLVERRLDGASCYFVSKTWGKMHALDNPDTVEGDRRWRGPVNWLKPLERYWLPPCEHDWQPIGVSKPGWYVCKRVLKKERRDGDSDATYEEECGDEMQGRWDERAQRHNRPAETRRKSWGLHGTLETLDMRRQAYQRFVNADRVLVVWGETRTGKTAFIADLGPDSGCFRPEDIFMPGKGDADRMGMLKPSTAICWLNEYKENMLKAEEFKALAEGAMQASRGMHRASGLVAAKCPKFVSINGINVKVKELLRDPVTKQPMKDDKGVEIMVEREKMRPPFGKNYDKDGAIRSRLYMAEMSIRPVRIDQELNDRIKREWVDILVYLMTLRYVPLRKRAAWRRQTNYVVDRGDRARDMMIDAEGSMEAVVALPTPAPAAAPAPAAPAPAPPQNMLSRILQSMQNNAQDAEQQEVDRATAIFSRAPPNPTSTPLKPSATHPQPVPRRRREEQEEEPPVSLLGGEDAMMAAPPSSSSRKRLRRTNSGSQAADELEEAVTLQPPAEGDEADELVSLAGDYSLLGGEGSL